MLFVCGRCFLLLAGALSSWQVLCAGGRRFVQVAGCLCIGQVVGAAHWCALPTVPSWCVQVPGVKGAVGSTNRSGESSPTDTNGRTGGRGGATSFLI